MSHSQEKGSATEEKLAQLQQEVELLREQARQEKDAAPSRATRAPGRRRVERNGTIVLAPGVTTTTVPGSIYSTSLAVLAQVGNLALQDALFREFGTNPSPESARKLLDELGVYYKEVEQLVRADVQFKEHCDRRTVLLKNRAARGEKKAKKVLANPDICSRGRWHGDLHEAVSILRGASRPAQWMRGRNQRILRRCGLMFATSQRAGEAVCFLYRRVHHGLFRQARELAGE